MKYFGKRVVLVILLVAILGLGAAWVMRGHHNESVSFETAPVQRGDLTTSISATGTVEPEELVNVGAQVAGKILSFGKDQSGKTIDYGSSVEEGTILAQIDDSLYAADVAEAKARLDVAKAGVLRAQADLGQLQAKLFQAERDWKRAKKLGPSDALSQSDFDADQSAYEVARANVAVGEAANVQAQSTVEQAQATLRRAQQNLDYCTIKSPVKGVIIDRRVNIGQTVVSSLNAPSLFLIAKDLRRMQVWVSVNEADIGSIQPGQQVSFTVDAFPGEMFNGEVGKIRLNASMTQNVVTYTVEVTTDNSNQRLLPYLTANAKFLVRERRGVLMVPNAALRFNPAPDKIAAGSGWGGENQRESGVKTAGEVAGKARQAQQTTSSSGTVWLLDDSMPRPVSVAIGITDGTMTEVQSDQIKEGTLVVVGEKQVEGKEAASGGSPFIPQFRGGRRPPGR